MTLVWDTRCSTSPRSSSGCRLRTSGSARDVWARRWQREVPGCEPERAAVLLAPIGALRQALIYQVFLDGIEPDERIYHASDPALWLARAADAARRPDRALRIQSTPVTAPPMQPV